MQGDKELKICYTTQKGNCLTDRSVTVSVTAERYEKITAQELKEFAEKLVELQGYGKLYNYGVNFEEKPHDGKHVCKYCGGLAEGTFEDLLCGECRETFGHSLYSEL